jgi:hypothetical protein
VSWKIKLFIFAAFHFARSLSLSLCAMLPLTSARVVMIGAIVSRAQSHHCPSPLSTKTSRPCKISPWIHKSLQNCQPCISRRCSGKWRTVKSCSIGLVFHTPSSRHNLFLWPVSVKLTLSTSTMTLGWTSANVCSKKLCITSDTSRDMESLNHSKGKKSDLSRVCHI